MIHHLKRKPREVMCLTGLAPRGQFVMPLGWLTFTVPVGQYLREVSCICCSVIFGSIKGEHVCFMSGYSFYRTFTGNYGAVPMGTQYLCAKFRVIF